MSTSSVGSLMVDVLACPHCGSTLALDEGGALCMSNHRFDRAKEGYLHLLPSGRKASTRLKGDTPEALRARRAFLSGGHYQPISDAVNDALGTVAGPLIDVGCGEGYYLSRMTAPERYGLDIAKEAVRMAAKADRGAQFVVGSTYRLPILDHSVAAVVSVFAPRPYEEFRRVVGDGGVIVTASPGPDHLRQLVNADPDDERRARRADDRLGPPLGSADAVHIRFDLELTDADQALLIEMTPLAWQAASRPVDALANVTVDVWVERSVV